MAATEYIIGVAGGTVRDFYNAGVVQAPTTPTGGTSRFSSSTNLVGMAVVDHTLYLGDGVDFNCRFNGLTVAKAGSAVPTSAPTATESASAGNVEPGAVTYVITYLDADGNESEPSDASVSITITGVGSQVNLTAIPNDTDTDRTGKNVYRRGPSSTAYRLVNEDPIGATATTYTDNVADGDLGAILVEGNTRFPPCARFWEHDNRLFGCGNSVDPRTLFISNEFAPWYCPASPDLDDPTQGLRLRAQGSNANITGGISHGGYCFIFTDDGGYILQGTTAEDYRMERFTSHGCTSHRSIKSLRNWLFWCGPDGVYRYDGEKTERIDDNIRTYFTTQTAANLALVSAWLYDNRYCVSFPTGASAVKCYDTREEEWVTLKYPDVYRVATIAASNSTNAGVPRVFVANQTHGVVIQLEKPATYTDARGDSAAADNIEIKYASKVFNMGLHGRDKRVHLWGYKVKNPASLTGSLTITAALAVAGTSLGTIADATPMQVEDSTLTTTSAGDDTAITPTTSRVMTIRHEAFEQARSELHQLYITTAGAATLSDFRITEIELYWTMAS
jgi:hypothetical protein